MKRIKLSRDDAGKYRWTLWISSDIVGASTQGYASKADRDANLEEVMGGILQLFGPKQLVLVRPCQGASDEIIPVREATRDARSEDDETAAADG